MGLISYNSVLMSNGIK